MFPVAAFYCIAANGFRSDGLALARQTLYVLVVGVGGSLTSLRQAARAPPTHIRDGYYVPFPISTTRLALLSHGRDGRGRLLRGF